MSENFSITITEESIKLAEAFNFVAAESNGAASSFIGTIRNKNLGREVLGVSYDIHKPLAIKTITELCEEAQRSSLDTLRIFISHFQGRLNVGETSIAIAVGSPHRNESFVACRFLIEEIKHRCPIWKKEHYVDGNSEWVKGHALCQH